MNVIINQATTDTPPLWTGIGNVSFVPEDPEMRRASARGGVDFEGVGFNNFYLAILKVLNTHITTRDQHLLPDEGEVWIRPYLEAMKDFPETLLTKPGFRFFPLITFGAILFAIIIAGFTAKTYISSGHASSEFVTTVTISRPDSEPEVAFKTNLENVHIPEDFAEKIWVDDYNLNIKGVMTEENMAKLKNWIQYEPMKDALVVAAFQSSGQSKIIAAQQVATRQTCIILFIGVLLLIIFVGIRFREFNNRKRFLQSIIYARDSGNKDELRELIDAILQEDTGKPKLKWLRSEFRKFAPSLVSMIRGV